MRPLGSHFYKQAARCLKLLSQGWQPGGEAQKVNYLLSHIGVKQKTNSRLGKQLFFGGGRLNRRTNSPICAHPIRLTCLSSSEESIHWRVAYRPSQFLKCRPFPFPITKSHPWEVHSRDACLLVCGNDLPTNS